MGTASYSDRLEVLACLTQQRELEAKLAGLSLDALSGDELMTVLRHREQDTRVRAAFDTAVVAKWRDQSVPRDFGATSYKKALTGSLKISATEAHRRLGDADTMAPRVSLTGAALAPQWPHVAAARAAGKLGDEHVRIIVAFFNKLPARIDAATRERAETALADLASQFGPDEFRGMAHRIMLTLDPDGTFDERDIARRRNVIMGPQGVDGLTPIKGLLDPVCAASLEAIFAKLAAPGMCLPVDGTDGVTITVDGTPTEAQVGADTRSVGQRQHDALNAAARAVLSTGKLGSLNGLPTTVVITTTLADIDAAASAVAGFPLATTGFPKGAKGYAATGGRTLLPLRDMLKLLAHAHQCLAIFDDKGRPLHFGRSRRTASPDQRLLLYATDGGCTRPGCTVTAYLSEAHHVNQSWAALGCTDIENLALACPPDNRAVDQLGWKTAKDPDTGHVTWTSPPGIRSQAPPRESTSNDDGDDPN